jgi:hypothetical protein
MLNRIVPGVLALAAATSQAHEGHGLAGAHWHATDVVGFAVVVGLAAAAVWWSGRR